MVESNVTTLTLTGTEQEVRFSLKYPYFWCSNLSDTPVLMSKQSGIAEGADGVVIVPAGGAACTMHGYTDDVVYVSGTGKVQVMGTYSAFNPFKSVSGGGDSGGSGSGETNKIESISVNGQTVAPDANKNVNIEIPEMPEDIDAQTVNGHTVESNVPANAVFTDTVYTLPAASESALGGVLSGGDISVDENGSVTVNSVNGKTVGADVPEDAVFTDTTYSLSNSNNIITLTDSNGEKLQVRAVTRELISVAAGETAEIFSSENPTLYIRLRMLTVHTQPDQIHEYVWYDGSLTAIGSTTVSGFTVKTEYGSKTLFYTNSTSYGHSVWIYRF